MPFTLEKVATRAELRPRCRRAGRVRICANKVVAGVRVSTLLLKIRMQDARQFTSEQVFTQLEGLALARA